MNFEEKRLKDVFFFQTELNRKKESKYDEERQVTKPTSPLKAAVHIPNFDTLVPAPELSLPIQLCRHISKGIISLSASDSSGARKNESEEIRYVNGSFVAGTSVSSPGVPRHMHNY